MKRTKLTDFIIKNLKWTGVFLWYHVYFNRLSNVIREIKYNLDKIDSIVDRNGDVISGIEKGQFVTKIHVRYHFYNI